MTPSVTSARLLVIKLGSALVVDPDEAAPRTAWLDGLGCVPIYDLMEDLGRALSAGGMTPCAAS